MRELSLTVFARERGSENSTAKDKRTHSFFHKSSFFFNNQQVQTFKEIGLSKKHSFLNPVCVFSQSPSNVRHPDDSASGIKTQRGGTSV